MDFDEFSSIRSDLMEQGQKTKQKRRKVGLCEIKGCEEPRFKQRACEEHYNLRRWRAIRRKDPRWNKVCFIPGCVSAHRAHGYCKFHAPRLESIWLTITPLGICGVQLCGKSSREDYLCEDHLNERRLLLEQIRIELHKGHCIDCNSTEIHAKERCYKCYRKNLYRQHHPKKRKKKKRCKFDGCREKPIGKYCKKHLQQQARTGKMWPIKANMPEGLPCMDLECTSLAKCKALCKTCYARYARHGKLPTEQEIQDYYQTWTEYQKAQKREQRLQRKKELNKSPVKRPEPVPQEPSALCGFPFSDKRYPPCPRTATHGILCSWHHYLQLAKINPIPAPEGTPDACMANVIGIKCDQAPTPSGFCIPHMRRLRQRCWMRGKVRCYSCGRMSFLMPDGGCLHCLHDFVMKLAFNRYGPTIIVKKGGEPIQDLGEEDP